MDMLPGADLNVTGAHEFVLYLRNSCVTILCLKVSICGLRLLAAMKQGDDQFSIDKQHWSNVFE